MKKIALVILISILILTSCGFTQVDRGIAVVKVRGEECDYRLSWEIFLDSEVSEREMEDIEYEIADYIGRSIRLIKNTTDSLDEAFDTLKEQYNNFNLYSFRVRDITGHLEYMGSREVHPEEFWEALSIFNWGSPANGAQGIDAGGGGGSSGSGSLGGTAIGTSMGGSMGGAMGGAMGGLL